MSERTVAIDSWFSVDGAIEWSSEELADIERKATMQISQTTVSDMVKDGEGEKIARTSQMLRCQYSVTLEIDEGQEEAVVNLVIASLEVSFATLVGFPFLMRVTGERIDDEEVAHSISGSADLDKLFPLEGAYHQAYGMIISIAKRPEALFSTWYDCTQKLLFDHNFRGRWLKPLRWLQEANRPGGSDYIRVITAWAGFSAGLIQSAAADNDAALTTAFDIDAPSMPITSARELGDKEKAQVNSFIDTLSDAFSLEYINNYGAAIAILAKTSAGSKKIGGIVSKDSLDVESLMLRRKELGKELGTGDKGSRTRNNVMKAVASVVYDARNGVVHGDWINGGHDEEIQLTVSLIIALARQYFFKVVLGIEQHWSSTQTMHLRA